MASNINISPARIVQAAILHTLDNGYRFGSYGALQALRSPQLAQLISEMSPVTALNEGRLSKVSGSNTVRVALNYKRKFAPTVRTSRAVTDPSGLSLAAGAATTNVDFNVHREYDVLFTTDDIASVETQAQAYLSATNAGIVNATAGEYRMLGKWGDDIVRSIDDGILKPVEEQVITLLNAAAGLNLLYPLAAGASQSIDLYNAEGGLKKDFKQEMMKLKLAHGIKGRMILIHGMAGAQFLNLSGIASPADIGYDYGAMMRELDIEPYYSDQIDTLLGENEVLVLDPGSAAMEAILEHETLIQKGNVGNTFFGKSMLSVAQSNLDTFMLEHDFRVREYDTTAYPQWVVTPSIRFGVFTRPAGYFAATGNWATVTGIFKYNLVD